LGLGCRHVKASDVPYQHSSARYTFDERERSVLASLRGFLGARPALGRSPYLRRIREVRPKDFFDITAKVRS
jgi:hypothetical protein